MLGSRPSVDSGPCWLLEVDGRIYLAEERLGSRADVVGGREENDATWMTRARRPGSRSLGARAHFVPGRLAPRRCRWPGSRKYA